MILTLNATLEKISTRADRTLKIEFSTQELPEVDIATLFTHLNEYSHLAIKASEIEEIEIADLDTIEADPEDFTKKSPAQRLRAVLYRYAEKLGKEKEFELFYKQKMENLINQVKEKLDD